MWDWRDCHFFQTGPTLETLTRQIIYLFLIKRNLWFLVFFSQKIDLAVLPIACFDRSWCPAYTKSFEDFRHQPADYNDREESDFFMAVLLGLHVSKNCGGSKKGWSAPLRYTRILSKNVWHVGWRWNPGRRQCCASSTRSSSSGLVPLLWIETKEWVFSDLEINSEMPTSNQSQTCPLKLRSNKNKITKLHVVFDLSLSYWGLQPRAHHGRRWEYFTSSQTLPETET